MKYVQAIIRSKAVPMIVIKTSGASQQLISSYTASEPEPEHICMALDKERINVNFGFEPGETADFNNKTTHMNRIRMSTK